MKKPLKVVRPWGNFIQFTLNETTTVKIITVNPRQRLSLQSHQRRGELWYALDEDVKAEIEGRGKILSKGKSIFIPKGAKHRLTGLEKPARILEISFGHFDEKDEIRHQDDYGRIKS